MRMRQKGKMKDLGPLPDGSNSNANKNNDSGQVMGASDTAVVINHPVAWNK